jgi:hypothetical protein
LLTIIKTEIMIKLKVWEKSESTGESVAVGTVNSIAGKNGYYELTSERNFRSKSLVSLKVVDKEGASELLICGQDISDDLRGAKSEAEFNAVLDEIGNCTVVEKIMQARDKKTRALLFDEDDEPIMEEVYFVNRSTKTDMSNTRRTVTSTKEKVPAERVFNWDARIAGL